MRKILFLSSILLLCMCHSTSRITVNDVDSGIELFEESYPRAMYFRVAEFTIRNEYAGLPKYKEWRDKFSDLSGIMGKTESEELVRNNPHQQIYNWFKRFKNDFPKKAVIVHFNGRGRVPNYRIEKFSAGHWSYFEGAGVKSQLPEQFSLFFEKEIWIEVEDVTRFRMDNGRNKVTPDDITLVMIKEDGRFDWEYTEYVRLKEIDTRGGRIKIRRAMHGSKARAFLPDKTYAAPIVMGGPWGSTKNMVWYYNLSRTCPRDKDGKICADILVEELAENFAPGGRWETFDGVEFDVMTDNPTTGYHANRRVMGMFADTDGDGMQDNGIIDGVNEFGLGVFEFVTRLREKVGPDKILSADGRAIGSQKVGNGSLNGVEMEGVPEQWPYGWASWSTVYNTLGIWKTVAAKPDFNYSAFRYNNPDRLEKEILFKYYRLAFALSCFTETFIAANSWTTLQGIPNLKEVFQVPGINSPTGWLGKPLGDTEYIARDQALYPDILNGKGEDASFPKNLLGESEQSVYLKTENRYTANNGIMKLLPGEEEEMGLKIYNVPYREKQVYIEFSMRSVRNNLNYPEGYIRQLQVYSKGQKQRFKKILLPVTGEWNTYRVYLCNTTNEMNGNPINFNVKGRDDIDLVFMLPENIDPVEISSFMVCDAPEVILKKFEKGTVIANLSGSDYFHESLQVNIPFKDAVFIVHDR